MVRLCLVCKKISCNHTNITFHNSQNCDQSEANLQLECLPTNCGQPKANVQLECLPTNCGQPEANLQFECLPTNLKTEENNQNTTKFICKTEPVYTFDNKNTFLKCSKMEVEDIFDQDDQVDLSKLNQFLNDRNHTPEHSNIKREEQDTNSFLDEEPTIKIEKEESDTLECPLQLSERKYFTLKDENYQEFYKNRLIDAKIDINEVSLQSVECNGNRFVFEVDSDSEKQRLPAPTQSSDEELPKQHSYHISNEAAMKCLFSDSTNEHKRKVDCQFCDKLFINKQSLDNHLLKQHREEIEDHMKDFITNKIHSCNNCNYQSTHKCDLNKHVVSKHSEQKTTVNCQFCEKLCTSKRSLDIHILNQHREKINLIKNKIHDNSLKKETVVHMQKILGNCHQTAIKCLFTDSTEEHKRKIDCRFCDKSFTNKQSLDNHMLQQHKEEINGDMKDFITNKIHACNICNFQSTYKSDLNRHVDSNHSEQKTTVNCQFCEKSFASKRSLDGHVLNQHKEKISIIKSKIHKCDFCSYQTTRKNSLKKHIEGVHMKQKIIVSCQFCDKPFAKRSLDNHVLKQHSKEINSDMKNVITSKILQCHICSYKTTHRNHLNIHVNSIHNEQRIRVKCQLCDKSFTRKQSLDEHIVKKHL